ncbi:hypothetical protein [Massilia aerilata]|uniref:Uncharacterized protein n=1 Tax=Massilia aerilata TaxID=453817 RepID=A0ABW0S0A4_9BURK
MPNFTDVLADANLVRAGNLYMQQYQVYKLPPLATSLAELDAGALKEAAA